MANSYSRNANGPPDGSYDYNNYRPSSVQDLNVPYDRTNVPSALKPPPGSRQQDDPFNPYLRTEDVTRPYTDTPAYSDNNNPYPYGNTPLGPQQPFQPLHPSASYQDGYTKPNDPFPYVETNLNAPTPPLVSPKRRTLFSRLFDGEQRFAYFCWTISIIQIGVFIGELIKNAMVMKTPIQIQPTFNPLIGPSSYVLPLRMFLIEGIDQYGRQISAMYACYSWNHRYYHKYMAMFE